MFQTKEIICNKVQIETSSGNYWEIGVENENIVFKYVTNIDESIKAKDVPDVNTQTPIISSNNGTLKVDRLDTTKVKLSNWEFYRDLINLNSIRFDYNNQKEFRISP